MQKQEKKISVEISRRSRNPTGIGGGDCLRQCSAGAAGVAGRRTGLIVGDARNLQYTKTWMIQKINSPEQFK